MAAKALRRADEVVAANCKLMGKTMPLTPDIVF